MVKFNARIAFVASIASLLVAGCAPDDQIVPVGQAPAQGGSSPPPQPQPDPPPPPPPPVNRAPSITGSPATAAVVGSPYTFAPGASDADGDALVWSISGKPQDAIFSTATGTLTWTPAQPGTFAGIVITVTDARGASTSLAPFAINVGTQAVSGSATLSWSPPTSYTDGSALPASELSAYRIYSATDAAALERVAEVDSRTTSFIATNLVAGTHYFAVTAVTAGGEESSFSGVGSKVIR